MAGFHTQVRLTGFQFEDFQFTVKLAAGITAADVGKVVSQDTSADSTVKLAADGDAILGVLQTVENRTIEGQLIGTVSFKFAKTLPIKSGLTGNAVVARGSRLCGAGGGEVKAIDWSTPTATLAGIYANAPRVWAVNGLLADATKFS